MARTQAVKPQVEQTKLVRVVSEIVNISANAIGLDGAAEALGELARVADETAHGVVEISGTVSGSMTAIAGAVEEMSISLNDVAQGTTTAASAVQQVMSNADKARQTVAELESSSQAIRQVSHAIASVARQTNLLALNATIEAARAGEAGKGFAVVAGEVKDLSKQTEEATKQIDGSIKKLAADLERALAAIAEITAGMQQIDEMTSGVAAAVAQQTTVTGEISQHVSEAAAGSGEVAQSMLRVSEAISGARTEAIQVQRYSGRLVEGAMFLDGAAKALFKGEDPGPLPIEPGTAGQLRAAIRAHGEWKARLLQAVVSGHSDFDPAEVGRDDRCSLGKWLHGTSTPADRASDFYDGIVMLHGEFHSIAGRILDQALCGDQSQAAEAMEFGGELDQISLQLIGAINAWMESMSGL